MAQTQQVDLLIVGGGIHGAGIARDAAGRGLTVCLVEQSDLASFTSSASTKLIHGGLRYLEYFDFRLVREALRERERLLGIAPHLVRPLRFVLPHAEGLRPRWQIRLGLFLYDHIGGRDRLPASEAIRLAGDPIGEPIRRSFTHGFAYSDCSVDDSRLVVLNAMDAAERGASIRTRTRLVQARAAPGGWHAECVEEASGRPVDIQARALVNAAGSGSETVRRALGLQPATPPRLVKGSHIVVPRLFEGAHAYLLQNPDRRVVFAIPYEGRFTLIGTTDVPCEAEPAELRISPSEVSYLCESVNRYFVRSTSAQDVVWSYAGVRALQDDHAAQASEITRDYELRLERAEPGAPVLTVVGGKITTYRRLAEAALAALRPFVGGGSRNWTAQAPLPGGDLPGGDLELFVEQSRRLRSGFPPELLGRLARAYGTRMERILGSAGSIAELGATFGADLTAAEVEYLRSEELACTAEDILWRRSKLGLHISAEGVERLKHHLENTVAQRSLRARA